MALPPIDFKIFLIFLDFLRSLLKPFGAKFLVLEIKPRFTCAESTLKLKLKVLQPLINALKSVCHPPKMFVLFASMKAL